MAPPKGAGRPRARIRLQCGWAAPGEDDLARVVVADDARLHFWRGSRLGLKMLEAQLLINRSGPAAPSSLSMRETNPAGAEDELGWEPCGVMGRLLDAV